ncbi:MAG TPA: pyridoxamine 5'-phosphate oxidase family protein [Gemmatimonadaceae bacterium]|nr:pyridoxamine 5'-phosphate oxidase family protein [Gemmatimonadaceae bacterium]
MTEKATTIGKLAAMLRDLDVGMLTTRTDDGGLRARPMSNNGEVEFDGDVWFFSDADSRKVREIEADPRVELSYADTTHYRFVSMSGVASIVRDAAKKRALWMTELERWFDDGPESDAIVLVKVTPSIVAYWNGEDGGELTLA